MRILASPNTPEIACLESSTLVPILEQNLLDIFITWMLRPVNADTVIRVKTEKVRRMAHQPVTRIRVTPAFLPVATRFYNSELNSITVSCP
jgi:hypothetical protein